ncbi:alpha-N-arabinofuranosidase [Chromohalobacter moromii]|uniref:non-reducing end alpha-L-arabinofuranosidase n=1 Tax=Chromohalobacter moromii TaxID=2860329 RepID=A0A9X2X3S9_9GAMM|nr:alpha-N-arabinofuranosidase [Chromohalobacter moromii]MCK2045874.1 alpha-N-arabinofuranosidase [Chromohalobacter moromii]MCT8505702.1 alpha-N-arabinofuranosidase [Chromohalobacter moromii]
MHTRVTLHRDFVISEIDERLYGAFLEHMGRAIYSGIYEPGHPEANDDGFRRDVLDMVKELAPPIVRYPGGNFVSAYNWEDGIGPREERPVRLDLAWHSRESNQVGIHEFADWCELAGIDMMLAVNLGSRGIDAARNFLEYVNHPEGSAWSDLRIRNGRQAPWNVKLWCLGNEMDGPWQVGHKNADEYGHLANETGKALKAYDSSLELVACGSSNPDMASYPEWEATVLDHCYETVDYISLHMYFTNYADDLGSYLALSEKLDRYIGSIAGVIDYIKAKKRSTKDVHICFDEWNVWYHSTERDKRILQGNDWPFAPAILEDAYNVEDALLIGCVLNTFIRRSDRVRIACIAQLVNVIAPIMTESGGSAWRQTIFYPLYFASRFGRGKALRLAVDSPTYPVNELGDVPYLDVSAVHDEAQGTIALFIVNRHPSDSLEFDVDLGGFTSCRLIEHQSIDYPDMKAANTAERPGHIQPTPGQGLTVDGSALKGALTPLSYHMVRLEVAE